MQSQLVSLLEDLLWKDLKVVGSHPESSFDLSFLRLSSASSYCPFSCSFYHCFHPWLLHEAWRYPGSETDSGYHVGAIFSGLEWTFKHGRMKKAEKIPLSHIYANAPEQNLWAANVAKRRRIVDRLSGFSWRTSEVDCGRSSLNEVIIAAKVGAIFVLLKD